MYKNLSFDFLDGSYEIMGGRNEYYEITDALFKTTESNSLTFNSISTSITTQLNINLNTNKNHLAFFGFDRTYYL